MWILCVLLYWIHCCFLFICVGGLYFNEMILCLVNAWKDWNCEEDWRCWPASWELALFFFFFSPQNNWTFIRFTPTTFLFSSFCFLYYLITTMSFIFFFLATPFRCVLKAKFFAVDSKLEDSCKTKTLWDFSLYFALMFSRFELPVLVSSIN